MTIQEKINKALLKEQSKEREPSHMFSPSNLGKCYRRQYWKRKGEPPTNLPNERSLRIFAVGNLFHDFVQSFFDEAQVEVDCGTDDIAGRADIVLPDEVVDIKSQHSKGFWWMAKKGYNIEEEKAPDILQLMCYCWLLNKPKGRLVIVSKDDLCINEHVFFYEKWKDRLQAEIDMLRFLWKEDKLPKAEPRCYGSKKFGDKECIMEKSNIFCPYYDKCKGMENGHTQSA